jgi:hypothetical protein
VGGPKTFSICHFSLLTIGTAKAPSRRDAEEAINSQVD